MSNPEVVEALEQAGVPSAQVRERFRNTGCTAEWFREDVAADAPRVLRVLLRDAALRIYGWPDGNADALCLAVPLVSVTCDEPLTGAVRLDALLSLLAPEVDNG